MNETANVQFRYFFLACFWKYEVQSFFDQYWLLESLWCSNCAVQGNQTYFKNI